MAAIVWARRRAKGCGLFKPAGTGVDGSPEDISTAGVLMTRLSPPVFRRERFGGFTNAEPKGIEADIGVSDPASPGRDALEILRPNCEADDVFSAKFFRFLGFRGEDTGAICGSCCPSISPFNVEDNDGYEYE